MIANCAVAAPVPPLAIATVPVTLAEVPVTLIAQFPEAPVPVGDGISVPIINPRLVRAFGAVVAPVPPFAIATVPVTLPDVVAVVAVAAFPVMLIPQVPEAPVPVGLGMSVPIANPRLVRAAGAFAAPVPPDAMGRAVVNVNDPMVRVTS